MLTKKEILYFLAENYFLGDKKEELVRVANSGDDEKMSSAIYTADQIIDGRTK